jgi:5-(carboxyamino)imidazole ribonucleotide synthase
MNRSVILPGGCVGIIGSGQLGRMLALAARSLGYNVAVLSEAADEPATPIADHVVIGSYRDADSINQLAAVSDCLTLEFENIPADLLRAAATKCPMRPGPHVLAVAQDRLVEKQTLFDLGLPVTPFRRVDSRADGVDAAQLLGLPLVIKTSRDGYDGKGQSIVRTIDDLESAIHRLGPNDLIAEAFIPFQREASILVARGSDGQTITYPLIENSHHHHILDVSLCPATGSDAMHRAAEEIAVAVADGLHLVGLLCIELFVLEDGRLLINELAPRPHNSGHLTIEAFSCSQFEQAIRAACGLPLAVPHLRRPAAMANLLGDVWDRGEPRWADALRIPETSLHLYGKQDPRAGRKMGHLTSLGDDLAQAKQRVLQARAALRNAAASAP